MVDDDRHEDVERHLSNFRPAGPPPELKERVLAAAGAARKDAPRVRLLRRAWVRWTLAAAASVLVNLGGAAYDRSLPYNDAIRSAQTRGAGGGKAGSSASELYEEMGVALPERALVIGAAGERRPAGGADYLRCRSEIIKEP